MIRERILRIEQTLERLFGGRPPREPLEVRRAALEALLAQATAVGRGRKVLPFSRATIHVVAADASARRVLKEALEPGALTADLQRELERAGVSRPSGLDVQLRLVREPGKTWAPGARFHVTVAHDDEAAPEAPAAAASPAPTALAAATTILRVIAGEARPRSLKSESSRITIGRQVDVLDQSGKPVRHNDVAFIGEDEVSRSVSRAHAHVTFDRATRTHRLFDENSAHGTEIERDGRRLVVPAGRDGLKLRAGDQIRVGRAVIRFEVG